MKIENLLVPNRWQGSLLIKRCDSFVKPVPKDYFLHETNWNNRNNNDNNIVMINLLNTPMTSFCQVSTLEMKILRGYIFPRETRKKLIRKAFLTLGIWQININYLISPKKNFPREYTCLFPAFWQQIRKTNLHCTKGQKYQVDKATIKTSNTTTFNESRYFMTKGVNWNSKVL